MADQMFQNEILKWHNYYRDKHNTPPLRYNVNIGSIAQRWANELASTGQFTQSDPQTRIYYNQQLGENCAMKWTSTNEDFTGSEVVEQWCAEEESSFNFNDPDGQTAGHFSQVVWKNSTDIGVGKAQGPDGKWIVVANYYPAGNVIGRFRENVLPPIPSVGNIPYPSPQGPSPPMPSRPYPYQNQPVSGPMYGGPMYGGQMPDDPFHRHRSPMSQTRQMSRRRRLEECLDDDDFFSRDSDDAFFRDSNYQMGGNQTGRFEQSRQWQQGMQTPPNRTVSTRTETINGVTKTTTTERTMGPNGRKTIVTRESTRS